MHSILRKVTRGYRLILKVTIVSIFSLYAGIALAIQFPDQVFESWSSPIQTAREAFVDVIMDSYWYALLGDTVHFIWWWEAIQYTRVSNGDYEKTDFFTDFDWDETYFATGLLPTPLMIDLGRDSFDLSELGKGVYFDLIPQDNEEKYIQWVAPNNNDAFLALDLNGDGVINDGSELFGGGTVILQDDSTATNGYQALSQYDELANGGNNDGKITSLDAIWPDLSLWIDQNADGVSTTSEIQSLRDYQIISFDLDYRTTYRRVDSAGNWLPYWSWVTTENRRGLRKFKMVDVFFRVIE